MVIVGVVGPGQMLLLLIGLLVALGVGKHGGKALAAGLKDDQRKIVGGIAWSMAVVLAIYGIANLNSASGMAAIGFAIVAAVVGSTVIAAKGS